MIINRERSTCLGRGFGEADSFLTNFKAWIERPPVLIPTAKSDGGPGWHIIDDQSLSAIDPYIVISQHVETNGSNGTQDDPNRFDEPHKILKITAPTGIAGRVYVDGYLWWDTNAQTGYGHWFQNYVNTVDDGTFEYDFRGGPRIISIGAKAAGSWSFVSMVDWDGDVRFVAGPTVAAPITNSIDGYPTPVTNQWVTFNTKEEAENFILNKYYYLYDFSSGTFVDYCKVVAVDYDGDPSNKRVQLDRVCGDYSAGAVLTAYTHRFYSWATINSPLTGGSKMSIPYVSYKSADWTTSQGRINAGRVKADLAANTALINVNAPDDNGNYVSETPYVYEQTNGIGNSTDMDRGYGQLVEIFQTTSAGLSQMTSGRTLNSLNYVYQGIFVNSPLLIPDYDSTT